jgi:hypothetical protein
MTRQESDKIVRLVASVWPTFAVTDDVLEAWFFVLDDEPVAAAARAVKHLAKTAGGAFAPSLPDIAKAMRQLSSGHDSAELAWVRRDTPFAEAVWRAWGGDRRWGSLPDPKYCEDPVEAERTLSFARREFLELYRSMSERDLVEVSGLMLVAPRNGKLERISSMKWIEPNDESDA